MSKKIDENQQVADILNFWFGEHFENDMPVKDNSKLWFMGGAEVDEQITHQFADLLLQAESGDLSAWQQTPHGSLALILLLDQFSRNIYRGTVKAFANDAKALSIAKTMVADGSWKRLHLGQRIFVVLPYEHSEDLANQSTSVSLVRALINEADAIQEPAISGFLSHALEHEEIIQRFGRFPHRNPVLGRSSTEEELSYLAESGKYFGQK